MVQNNSMDNIFFIIGFSRSGTTAVAKILNTASNASVFVEQPPKMCIDSGMRYEGNLPEPKEFILKSKEKQIQDVQKQGMIYGDKNMNYLYFVKEMRELWPCKFVFLVRDGREVVRSAMNWDKKHPGRNYNRYEDHPEATITQPEEDFWDFGRIRPLKNNQIFSRWKSMDLFEKFAWSWNEYNKILIEHVKKLDQEEFIILDMSNVCVENIFQTFEFLNLNGYMKSKVSEMMKSKINTTHAEESQKFQHWSDWDEKMNRKFECYASEMMGKLGYF